MKKNNMDNKNKLKNKNSIIKRNIIILSTSFALMIVALIATILVLNPAKYEKKFMAYDGYYNSNQTTIGDTGKPDAQYIKMQSLYNINGSTVTVKSGATMPQANQFVSIETPTDLYAFGQLCNSNESSNASFRTYKYILLKDIDWKEGMTIPFNPIDNFSGTLDGNGYLIKNLSLTPVTSGTISVNYAMFRDLNAGGVIKNLGLIDTLISINASPSGTIYVANLCAVNNGTIDYVFVRDNQENYAQASDHTPGMSVLVPGFNISGVVGVNNGTFTNSYFAGSNIFNSQSSKPDDFQEVLLINNDGGTVSNLYFYDELIAEYDDSVPSNIKIKYSELNKTYNYLNHYGTYCADLQTLCDDVTNDPNTNWIVGSYYEDNNFGSLIDYKTPRLVKITNSNVTYDDTTKKYTVIINTTEDFNFMWNCMNYNSKFSDSSMIYKLKTNINMDDIALPSYNDSIQSEFTSYDTASPRTIYYNSYGYSLNATYKSYGVFPVFEGKMSYINFVVGTSETEVTVSADKSGTKAIGTAIGYAETATIDNVNVYANIKVDNEIGKYYVGGIAGAVGDKTVISNSTVNGKITTTNTSQGSVTDGNNDVPGIAIGGAVGYVGKSGGSLDTVLSTVDITSAGFTGKEVNIGGIAGAGYFINTNNLHNNGTINVGTSETAAQYSQIHLAGVIGRFLGMYSQATLFTNNGNINLYQASNSPTYYAGILNADIQTTDAGTFKLTYKGKPQFWASSLSNGANVNIYNANSNDTIMYTYGLNIKNDNNFQTQLSSVYNLNYKFASEATALGAMSIDMNIIKNFAPVIMSNNTTKEAYSISLTTIYNLRDINYTSSSEITTSSNRKYTACVLADYANYIDVKNEGNQTVTIDKAITSNLSFNGLFYELSSGFNATSIYNGGNISVTYTAIVTGNIYVSGICYANRNGFSSSEIQKYNPSSDNYDKTLVGSINNCINNGSISILSTRFSSIKYSTTTILSPNGQSYLGNTVETAFSNPVYVNGDIYVSGITSINESVITNTFNIGDLTAANYVQNTSSKYEVNAAGISILNVGQFAYILNSANDGDIKAINMSSGLTYLSEVNAAGITCRNDELEGNKNYSGNTSNPNSKQVISFTINYGSVYSYNYRYNITSTSQEPNAKSAGILAMGLCNVINVTNYGNIYGSETSSGIFGIVYYSKFTSEVNSNIFIANTLNYGNVYILERGYNHIHGSSYDDYNWIEYSDLLKLSISTAEQYSLTSVVRNTDYISVIGSIFSIINFSNSTNTDYIKIRYLISFNEQISISGFITGYQINANPEVSTFYSAHKGVNAKSGAYETDRYMGKFVQYAPLSSNAFTGLFVTNIDANENVTTETKTYNGVFSDKFSFMQAIKGNAEYLDYANFRTDIFISDYFEFVGAIYANSVLLEKIGWSNITYKAAAESFATTLDGVGTFVKHYAEKFDSLELISAALAADTWVSKCDSSMLLDITNMLIAKEDATSLRAMLDYIFTSGSSSYSIISSEIRSAILETVIAADTSISYSSLLDTLITYANGYSSLLADSVLSSDSAGQYLQNYINQLSNSTIESILTTYCNYLKDAETNNDYFTYKNSEQLRYDLLTAMFAEINDNEFYQDMAEVLEIDTAIGASSLSDVIKMYQGYTGLHEADKIALYKAIIFNNTSSTNLTNLVNFINAMATDISFYNRLIELGYSKTSLTNINNDISYNSDSNSEAIIDERIKLWNLIKDTDIFKSYINSVVTDTIYDKATEYNNTYQSITEPHNDGAYIGDTSDNRLSYMYTLDITPQVYFYGPYINSNGDWFTSSDTNLTDNERLTGGKTNDQPNAGLPQVIVNQQNLNVGANTDRYFSLFHYSDNSLWESNDIMLSRGGANSTITFSSALTATGTAGNANYPYPMLLYYDYNNEQLGGANQEYTLNANYYVSGTYTAGETKFRGFSTNQQIKYDKSAADPLVTPITNKNYTTNDWTGTLFRTNDLYMYVSNTGETFSLNKAVLAKAFSNGGGTTLQIGNRQVDTQNYRCYIQDSDGAYHLIQTNGDTDTIQIGRMVDGQFQAIHTLKNYASNSKDIYSFISYELGLRMYTSCVSNNATTGLHSTGRTGIYRRSGGWNNYFTWKQSKRTRVFTSQYIDYSVNDLLNLDGYLTQYLDGTFKSTDERSIINRIFNTYFVTDSSTFAKVVAAALLERNMYDISYNADINYIDNFFISSIYSTTTINGVAPLQYLNQSFTSNDNKTTVKQYLINHAGGNDDYKTKFIAYCTSNQKAYAKLILKMIELNSDVYNLNTILARGIGSSTDPGAISITNVSSYDNVYFVNQPTTINNEDLTYGMKFDEITFTLNPEWKKIYLYVKPVETSGTLNVKLNSDTTGTNYVVTANNNNYIEVTLNNNTSLTLTANNDVILYKVLVNYSEDVTTSTTGTYTTNVRNSTTQSQANRSVTIPTAATLTTQIQNQLTADNIRYANVQITGVSIAITGRNSNYRLRTVGIGVNTNNIIEYIDINGNAESIFTPITNMSYLGQIINIYYDSGWYTPTWDQDNSIIISRCDITVTYSYDRTDNVTRNIPLLDDTSAETYINNSFTKFDKCNKTLDELNDYSTKYNAFVRNALYGLTPIDYSSTLTNPSYEETASQNIIEILGLSETHTDNVSPEYCVPDFLKLFITSSNSAFKSFIDSAVALSENNITDYSIILKDLINKVGYYSLVDAINARGQNLTDESIYIIAAAYLASDYRYILDSNLSVYDSKLRLYIEYLGNTCTYINSNGTYDNNKFVKFCETIGYNLSTTGYGIYALASNQGKLNGQFIPDNLELDEMDAYYKVDAYVGYKLVDTASSDATWRGGESDITVTTSVNYAFYKEMRQLEKSISTVVFDLTLTDGTDLYYGDIDLDTHTITYYIEELNSSTTFTVENIDLAYKAVAQPGARNSYDKDVTSFAEDSTFTASTLNVISYQFTVFAEDRSVHNVYNIVFKKLTTTLTMTYSDGTDSKTITSSTTDTTVTLNIKSKNEPLRKGLNLEHYLSFVNTADNSIVYKMNFEFITLSALSTDHRIKEDGSAVATMVVSYKIPAGTYHITLSICGFEVFVTYKKEASSECTIVAKFNGENKNIFASGMTANSEIPFGRLYNNIELTDYDDFYKGAYGEFYLDYFEYSANATLTVTAVKEAIDVLLDSKVIYQKYKYTITYVIAAEDGDSEHVNTYTHILTEKDPYTDGDQFGTVTKDGNAVTYINPSTEKMYNQTDTVTNDIVVSLQYSSETESRARVQFDRANENGSLNEPQYRITYNMENIYLESPYIVFTATDVTKDENIAGSAGVKTRYHGLSGDFNSNTETGFYELMYTYTNNGKWYTLDENNRVTLNADNQVVYADYSSTYNFPILQVNKLFSLDATLHSITFIDSYKGISAASTGMRVGPMRPTKTDISTDPKPGDFDEICYEDQLNDTNNWGIAVDVDGSIDYHNFTEGADYGSSAYKDYYIVGSIANAQLSNYAPTFAIEENALIFQYVTARIRSDYGAGKQVDQQGNLLYSDAEILGDHSSTTYLYVPFTYQKTENGKTVTIDETFLVELAGNGKTLTNVYTAKEFTSTGKSIGKTIYQAATSNAAITFSYDGIEYTLNKAAFGKPTNNSSLYMDYIGSPAEDHFWYVSYVVYSENYIKSANNTYVKYYHIALIDRSNNVYFEVTVIVPADFDITKYSTLYMLINGYYKAGTAQSSTFEELAVGAYVYKPVDYTLNGVAKKKYSLRYSIQMLPSAYYYFNLDLPVGYQIEATITNKPNSNAIGDYLGGNPDNAEHTLTYNGAYLPPSSIVAQVVKLTLNVTEGATTETNVWGISSSDVYTRRATLDNDQVVGN